jgi:thiol-disulfide isomerase/thioredoxin
MKVPTPQQSAGIMPNPGWTPAIGEANRNWPPTLEIPGPRTKPGVETDKGLPSPPPPPTPGGEPPPPSVPGVPTTTPTAPAHPDVSAARVPSCVLVGKQLVNFALNDINGETFEFKSQKRGKVALIDFWATYCIPCQKTIPQLRSLQNRYGSQGLEVIGVAYESGGTIQEQAHRVNTVNQRLQINYRQLLGSGPQCPVRAQLNIQLVPTLILVDEGGWILWRHEGMPDRATMDELERRIQRALAGKAS